MSNVCSFQINYPAIISQFPSKLPISYICLLYTSFVTEFPMNAAGKILKYKMREMAVEILNLQEANEAVSYTHLGNI